MQVIQQSVTLLKLQERPIGIWMFSSFTAVLGLLIFISFESPVDWFGLLCIFLANLMMFWSPVKTCVFDKKLNRVTLKQQGWLGTKVIEYAINEIILIQVEESKLIGTIFYKIKLNLLSGKQFYLTKIPSTDWELQQKIANYVRAFLFNELA